MAYPNGMHFHCPVNGWDCPYYKDTEIIKGNEEHCLCNYPGDPYYGCDDFYEMYGDDCSVEDYADFGEDMVDK